MSSGKRSRRPRVANSELREFFGSMRGKFPVRLGIVVIKYRWHDDNLREKSEVDNDPFG